MTRFCAYCGIPDDIRPYGKNGSMICFSCAHRTAETKAEAERQFIMQLNAAHALPLAAAVIGTEVGPYPLEHHK